MSAEQSEATGPDLSKGIRFSEIPDGGMIGGHVGDQPVLVARSGQEIFAIGASCTHYGGPLADGVIVGDTVRCPWHHACFSLRTGEALRAPALKPVSVWGIERTGDTVRVTIEVPALDGATHQGSAVSRVSDPRSILIIGAGAAGSAAAEMLRRRGFTGNITMVGRDADPPYDRPNISKDYLAGNAPEDWIPLRPDAFYAKHRIELIRGVSVIAVDVEKKIATLSSGESRQFDQLLLATGAEPVKLPVPGADLPHVHYLRTLADSRSIIAATSSAHRAVVIGTSFIGLEVAASLRARGVAVNVIAPETIPLSRVLGEEMGTYIQRLHEEKGVTFHLGRTAREIGRDTVTLDDGTTLRADLVVIGIGVRPLTELAESMGLLTEKGVVVNAMMETSIPGIFAAGDIARFPDATTGALIRIEHWVVAQRQGQVAACNMLGEAARYESAPFFWTNHYDAAISYTGHAEGWDEIRVSGKIDDGDCLIGYRLGDHIVAAAAMGREKDSLAAEIAIENGHWAKLESLFAATHDAADVTPTGNVKK